MPLPPSPDPLSRALCRLARHHPLPGRQGQADSLPRMRLRTSLHFWPAPLPKARLADLFLGKPQAFKVDFQGVEHHDHHH